MVSILTVIGFFSIQFAFVTMGVAVHVRARNPKRPRTVVSIEQTVRKISASIFLPVDVDYDKHLVILFRVLIVGVFVAIVSLAIPPVVDYLIARDIWPISSIRSSPDTWKRWLSFSEILNGVLLVLFVGGSVIGELISKTAEDQLRDLEERIAREGQSKMNAAKSRLDSLIEMHFQLLRGITLSNSFTRIFQIYKNSRKIYRHVYRTGNVNMYFFLTKCGVAFPGGVFGLISVFIFWLLASTWVLQEYVSQVIVN